MGLRGSADGNMLPRYCRGDSFERYLRRNFGAGDKNDEGRAA